MTSIRSPGVTSIYVLVARTRTAVAPAEAGRPSPAIPEPEEALG